jgi:tetrahydromethanopterin S-methyltransferase subunit A
VTSDGVENVRGGKPGQALAAIRTELARAVTARKCHGCGCLHQTVEALEATALGAGELATTLAEARSVFTPKEYECLGCRVCYPANAANAFAEAFPEDSSALKVCPGEEPAARRGWPPLPGDYEVIRYRAPVALCTLNSKGLAAHLVEAAPEGLAISGTLETENLGIERVIRNVLANPHLRFLVLCGEDTHRAIGHLPGQSLASLFESGIDERGRIRGAQGKRPILKNVTGAQVDGFLRQIKLVPMIGEEDEAQILAQVRHCVAQDPGPFQGAPSDVRVEAVEAKEPRRLTPDPAGFFVVYPEAPRRRLTVEHYTKDGVLDSVIEGRTPSAVYGEIIQRKLVSRLDHAAYLGRELARAERSMGTGETYVQDRAAGEIRAEGPARESECASGCREGGES